MRSLSRKWLAFGALTALLLVAVSAYVSSWALFEASDVRRGSIPYFLGVPSSIRQLPIVRECTPPLYRWRGRDGESSPFVEVSYSSRAGADEILKAYDAALKPAACKLTLTEARGAQTTATFECGGSEFLSTSVRVGSESPCASVELGFIENY
jgi:hypothetical protein